METEFFFQHSWTLTGGNTKQIGKCTIYSQSAILLSECLVVQRGSEHIKAEAPPHRPRETNALRNFVIPAHAW